MTATQADSGIAAAARQKLREDWLKNLIVNFGDDEGNEISFNGTVVQALMLMNGRELNDAVAHFERGRLALALSQRTQRAVLDHLFLASLNRPPSEADVKAFTREVSLLRAGIVRTRLPATIWQDLFWSLLNSNEFILNH
jgi:hypothetical protein